MQDKKLPIPKFGVLPQTEEEDLDPKATRRRQLREIRASRIPTKPANYSGTDTVISGIKTSKQRRQKNTKPSPPTSKSKPETSKPDTSQPAKLTKSDEIGKLQTSLFFKQICNNLDVLFEILQKLSETMCLIHNYSSKLIHVQMIGNKLYIYTKTHHDKSFFLQKIIPLFYSKHRLKAWLVY